MPDALATILWEYLETWKANPEGFLFLNRGRRLFKATKVVQLGLWPLLDKLKIPSLTRWKAEPSLSSRKVFAATQIAEGWTCLESPWKSCFVG